MADGEAVLHARALLALTDGEYDFSAYDDSTACIFSRPETTSSVPGNLTYGRILVCPNPANQMLYIRCEQVAEPLLPFVLYNAVGQLIAQQTLTSQNAQLPIGDLPEGLYYYFVGKGYSGKVIIQH